MDSINWNRVYSQSVQCVQARDVHGGQYPSTYEIRETMLRIELIIAGIIMRDDFSDDDIVKFQRDIDLWYHVWMNLTGREGMTHYIHLFGAGYISYYLNKYFNLYRYSNQSQERLNKSVKRFYLQHTQQGDHGKCAGNDVFETYICQETKPIARWLQRVIMWNTGLGEVFFY